MTKRAEMNEPSMMMMILQQQAPGCGFDAWCGGKGA